MVALKGHHYISFSLHYINFDLCEKILCDYVYIIILHLYIIILHVYINILHVYIIIFYVLWAKLSLRFGTVDVWSVACH